MIKHGMDVHMKFLNPGQIAMDAPLNALAKLTQWSWPHTHGEDKYVVMFGGLHIEMAMWKTFGDFLEASGWTTALIQAGIASSGTADSFLQAAHLTRMRHASVLAYYNKMLFYSLRDHMMSNIPVLGYHSQDGNSWLDLCLSP